MLLALPSQLDYVQARRPVVFEKISPVSFNRNDAGHAGDPRYTSTARPSACIHTTELFREKEKKEKKSRAGSPNNNDDDISTLLDITEEVEPLGYNQWALVASSFNAWAAKNSRPQRDLDSLKGKFDKLANNKKPTGDPSCPPVARRAKRIAREILSKCNAFAFDDDSSSSDSDESVMNLTVADGPSETCEITSASAGSDGTATNAAIEAEKASTGNRGTVLKGTKRKSKTRTKNETIKKAIGIRKNSRRPGAAGLKHKTTADNDIMSYVGSLSNSINAMSKVICTPKIDNHGLGRSEIQEIVKGEIKTELSETKESLAELKEMMKAFMTRK